MPSSSSIRAGAAYVELYANDSKLAKGLKKAQAKLKAFGGMVRGVGSSMLAASAALSTPFVAGTAVFANFEQQMANVSTMLERPQDHMDRFRKGIREMSVDFGESTETLAGGLYDILSASVAPQKALEVLAVSARAAKAGLTDTKTAADAITTILNSYGLSADKAASISDLLFSVVKRGKTDFATLAPSIGLVASTAAAGGVSLEELGAALATLTRNGVKTENAVTAVNAIIASFLKPTDAAAEKAGELGFELKSSTIEAIGLEGVFKKISHLPPDAIAKLFPNTRALRGVIPAIKNMQGFTEDIGVMQKRAGATEVAYKKMTSILAHTFAQARQVGSLILSVVGEALAEKVSKGAKAIKEYGLRIVELIQKNRGLIVIAAKIVLAIGAVGGALLSVGIAAGALSVAFGGIVSILGAVGTVVGLVGTALAALLSPMGIVIAAAVALGTYLVTASGMGADAIDWLGEKFEELKEIALAAFRGIGDAIAAGDLKLAAKILWLSLKTEWQRGINFLKNIWLGFKGFFAEVSAKAVYGAARIFVSGWGSIQRGWVEAVSFLSETWTNFTSLLRSAWEEAVGFLSKGMLKLQGLFDKSLDVEAAISYVDESTGFARKEIENQRREKLAETEKGKRERLTEIETDRSAQLAGLAEMAGAEQQARRERYAAELKASEEELSKARSEWRAAIAEAAKKRTESDKSAKLKGTDKPKLNLESVKAQIKAALPEITAARKESVEVRGTFNPAAILSLAGGGNAADRTAKATEETARNTKRLLDQARDSGLAFS